MYQLLLIFLCGVISFFQLWFCVTCDIALFCVKNCKLFFEQREMFEIFAEKAFDFILCILKEFYSIWNSYRHNVTTYKETLSIQKSKRRQFHLCGIVNFTNAKKVNLKRTDFDQITIFYQIKSFALIHMLFNLYLDHHIKR